MLKIRELNLSLLLDNDLTERFKVLEPRYNIPGSTPYSISKNLTLLAPGNSILMEYLLDDVSDEEDTIVNEL